MDKGWICIYRNLLDKPIWQTSTPEQKCILITLLLMANHSEREWEWKGEKFICKAGQFITSLDGIVKKTGAGISTRNVRTAIDRFEKYEFLTNESTNKNRLITICNWEEYQSKDFADDKQNDKQLTSNRQAADKQLTTNNNDNNDNNETIEQIYGLYPSRCVVKNSPTGKSRKNKDKIAKLINEVGYDKLSNTIKWYVEECRMHKTYMMNFSTFLNNLPEIPEESKVTLNQSPKNEYQ